MREPYGKAVAPQTGPTPWRCVRKDVLQALAGVRAGWVLSREIILSGASRPFSNAEGNTGRIANARCARGPARSKTPCMYVDSPHRSGDTIANAALCSAFGSCPRRPGQRTHDNGPQRLAIGVTSSPAARSRRQQA